METTAAKLEALINQASTFLDAIAFELDLKIKKETNMQSSLIGLIQMVHEMAKELDDIMKEIGSLVNDQEEIKQKLIQFTPRLLKKLQQLEDGSNNNNNSNTCNYTIACSDLIHKLDNLHV